MPAATASGRGIDHQADYLERLWWYPEKRSAVARIVDAVFRRA